MNANELTYGIEIETIAPARAIEAGLQIGGYHRGIQVPYLPAGWTAERDGSIDNSAGGLQCEIVSPVLTGPEGLAQIKEVLDALEAHGHRVNRSCGVHIHVGWERDWPVDALARLVTITSYAEKGLFAITGTKARERGIYCGGVRKYGNGKLAKEAVDRNRYHALNLTNLANNVRETVEFRIFSGSTNATKVIGWVQVCLGLVERAMVSRRAPKWVPAPARGGWRKAGEGQSEAERLMGFLAWGTGYARQHNGQQYGWISDVVSQDEVRREFRRLAAKYDAEA